MERRTKKMLLAILMIISVLATDFLVLGSGIMTYASELSSSTNNENVEFLAYFKEGENRVDSIQKSIKAEDVRLYAEIKVKNEGYLKEGTVIELENNNFNLKQEILEANKYINSIEGNKVNLKQINAGETVEIELEIEPIIADKIETEFLSKISKVKMIGAYVYSKDEEGQSIRTDKEVCINYQPDDTTGAELTAEIITNTELSVSGTNKRIVQLLIKSRITNNEFPVKQTSISADIPVINGETPEVSAMAISELATNGTTEISSVTTEDGKVKVTIENNPDENNQINWNKNIYDEILITYIYSDAVKESDIVYMDANVWMNVYNYENPYMATISKNQAIGETIPESNNIVIGKTEITTQEMYKGSIYANIETKYNTETKIVITNQNVTDQIVVYEGSDVFGTTESELSANTKYISTEINLQKMLDVLGENGAIEIKNGETTNTINKDTEVDENGNVVIKYENGTAELDIKVSNPESIGILEFKHTKSIMASEHTRAKLQKVKTLNTKNTMMAYLEESRILERYTETTTLELKETKTKAELTIENNKTELSTTEANEVTLGVTLVTNGYEYDLFKNPQISLKFPAAVENVELISTANKQNAGEFTINAGEFNTTNKTMLINIDGEQKTYSESELTQGYIQLNLKVTLDSLALSQADKIMMAYTNENATQYEQDVNGIGVDVQNIYISAPSQLIKRFNLSSNEDTSLTEPLLHRVKENEAGKALEFAMSLTNNKDSNISNLKILGKLPTTGVAIAEQDENTLETTLKGISAENATIYYTENVNATEDIDNATNGWVSDLALLTNAKLYLIKVDSFARGTTYNATLNIELPNEINANGISYTQYEVIYDTPSEKEVKESSRKIGLASSLAATIKTEISAQVGQDILQNGDEVKEGEVIKYTVNVYNAGIDTLENVQLKLDVPEGTTYVRPIPEIVSEDGIIIQEGYFTAEGYYEEVTDSEQLEELTTIIIPQLTTTKSYTVEYEVRVNKGTANTEISNISKVIYDETKISSVEFKNNIQEANIRVSIEESMNDEMYAGGQARYKVYIENMSNTIINNLELKIISDAFNIETIETEEISLYGEDIPEKITISELTANSRLFFKFDGTSNNNVEEINITAIVSDSFGNTYRANLVRQELIDAKATIDISSPQNEEIIKEGDIVEYNITAKNTGNIKESIAITGQIPSIVKVQSIYVNGKVEKQCTDETNTSTYVKNIDNEIYETAKLEVNETIQVKITAKVGYVPEEYNGKAINNRVDVFAEGVLKDSSEIISHVLKANDENVENVISGIVWFDENENGQIDYKEEKMSRITVKLYDISAENYLKDENNRSVQTITNNNGEYSFSNIKDGSYLVIFEYDTEKYVLTTPLVENVDSSLNSKASIKTINDGIYLTRLAAIELQDLNTNMFGMNLGLKGNTGDTPEEEQPGVEKAPTTPVNPENPTQPENPDSPTEPGNPNNPNNPNIPTEPEDPDNPTTPEQPIETKTISGFAWLDEDRNGQKDNNETKLEGIKVKIYNVSTKDYLKDNDGNIIEKTTDSNGKYIFDNIEKGTYIILFEYDTEKYEPTKCMATGVDEAKNSKVVLKTININGEEKTVAVTDTINVQENVSNINIGLIENLKFDLELNKYISRIVVQTSKETKTYNYKEDTFEKIEIHRKQVQGALVVLEYTITIKNNGEIAGYAKNIVDYLPDGLTFSSELNSNWYVSGKYLYTKSFENTQINPGEEKEIKLILTKTMTEQNVGLINNRAEIYQDYNKYGESDIDSTPNNQIQSEDDFGVTDVIIQVATGGSTMAYIILAVINLVLIYVAIRIMIANGIIEIKTKEERR